jgi:hypothetical protein
MGRAVARSAPARVTSPVVFQFEHPDRPLGDNVRKAAKAEFDLAIAEVGETGFEVHGTVRNVRRRLKRVRSLLRLIRPVFADYANENSALRDICAEVRELRDAMALVEAADHLGRGVDGGLGLALDRLRHELANRAASREASLDREAFLADLRAKLRDARMRSELWELKGDGRAAVVPGFVDTYRRARRGMKEARTASEETAFHEWRKAVKHHAGQLSILRGLVPPFAHARLRRAKQLAITLGELQNLCVLRLAIGDDETLAKEADKALVDELCSIEIAAARRRALRLGKPLFAESPRLVEARWEAYWLDWQAARRMG